MGRSPQERHKEQEFAFARFDVKAGGRALTYACLFLDADRPALLHYDQT